MPPLEPADMPQTQQPVIFHADDYGISVAQSEHILDCSSLIGGSGALRSLSIMANSPAFEACADLLQRRISENLPQSERFLIGIHLNVVEGLCCADPRSIPLLVDGTGMFRLSFVQMLRSSKGPSRDELQRQLEIEVAAQIDKVIKRFPALAGNLRIDGHQHFHLIPALFDAILAVIAREGYRLTYLRIPAEPIAPFLATPSVLFTLKPINWVKHWVLNWLWRRDRASLEAAGYDRNVVSAVFMGILMSGTMDIRRVGALLPAMRSYADKHRMPLEVLLHPGAVDKADCLNPALDGFVDFYTSKGRTLEYETLESIEGRFWDGSKSVPSDS